MYLDVGRMDRKRPLRLPGRHLLQRCRNGHRPGQLGPDVLLHPYDVAARSVKGEGNGKTAVSAPAGAVYQLEAGPFRSILGFLRGYKLPTA
jgi:hypothetical protein